MQLMIPISSSLFVGHIGSAAFLGASALGNMFANATGFAVGSGLAMALDTLCSQAFGAKKYNLVGLHCQRAMVILTIACIPIALVWYNAWVVLQFIGTEETASLSQYWLRRLIPSIWPRLMYEAYKRYLIGQRIMWPVTASVGATGPIHVFNTWFFIYYLGWGFQGAAYATTISYWLLFIFVVFFSEMRLVFLRRRVKRHKHVELSEQEHFSINGEDDEADEDNEADDDADDMKDGADLKAPVIAKRKKSAKKEEELDMGDPLHTWPKWSLDVFKGWGAFFSLGGATCASLFIEWGSFEVNAAIASRLGEVPLATHAILSNVAGLWYCIPTGFASAATALVGNMLGAGEPDRAFLYTRLAFGLEAIYGVLNGGLGMLYRHQLGRWFTNDEEVIKLVSQMIWVMWIYGIVDAMKCVGMGVLRGSGRPQITVAGNILSCIVVGYPVALFLVFKAQFGLQGLWLGMSCAWLTASTIYAIIVSRTNWKQEVFKAGERNARALLSTHLGSKRAAQKLLDISVAQEHPDAEGEAEVERPFVLPAEI